MLLQEMIAPLIAFKCEHGDYNLTFKIRGKIIEIEAVTLEKNKKSSLELHLIRSAYGGQGKADLGDFMQMLSDDITHIK